MCWNIYIATSRPLTNVNWTKDLPSGRQPLPLHFEEVKAEDVAYQAYHSLFKATHLYYLGSDTGCSCGFNYHPPWEWEEESSEEKERLKNLTASPKALIEFIKNFTTSQLLQMYVVWEDDREKPPEIFRDMEAKQLSLQNYCTLKSRCFYTFKGIRTP